MKSFIVYFVFLFLNFIWKNVSASCSGLNNCSGHGKCSSTECDCFEGWGSLSDISTYKSPDCSTRICPTGNSWADLPKYDWNQILEYKLLNHQPAECSDRGICNRITGQCLCDSEYYGKACEKMLCPNDCSGHGVCMTLSRYANERSGLPLTNYIYRYDSFNNSAAWDDAKIHVCLCDSSWPVGLNTGERQESEWFGSDCSLRHCPSADNPRTSIDETDCSQKVNVDNQTFASLNNNRALGTKGNLCQVDCANQGICDFSSGTCHCFQGRFGVDCSNMIELSSGLDSADHPDGIYASSMAVQDQSDPINPHPYFTEDWDTSGNR